jgi:hypothetical protein
VARQRQTLILQAAQSPALALCQRLPVELRRQARVALGTTSYSRHRSSRHQRAVQAAAQQAHQAQAVVEVMLDSVQAVEVAVQE